MSSASTDLTARARIRNEALVEFGEHGFTRTTLRSIAARAGVSPALVVHHFGSKEGLRAACDEYLLAHIRTAKAAVLAQGHSPSPVAYLAQHPEFSVMYPYLRRLLLDGGSTATAFFDDFVGDVTDYLDIGEKSGAIRPYPDREARAVIMTALSLGLMVFDDRIAARLGGENLLDPPVLERYTAFVMDLYAKGLFTAAFSIDAPTPPPSPNDPPTAAPPSDPEDPS